MFTHVYVLLILISYEQHIIQSPLVWHCRRRPCWGLAPCQSESLPAGVKSPPLPDGGISPSCSSLSSTPPSAPPTHPPGPLSQIWGTAKNEEEREGQGERVRKGREWDREREWDRHTGNISVLSGFNWSVIWPNNGRLVLGFELTNFPSVVQCLNPWVTLF